MKNLILTQDSYLFVHKYFTNIFKIKNTKVLFIKETSRGIPRKYFEIIYYFGFFNFLLLAILEILNKILFIFSKRKYEYLFINDQDTNKYLENLLSNNSYDNVVSIGCPCKLNESLIKKYNINLLNLHGGILPYQKGRFSPLKSIKKNQKYLGATIHIISNMFDSGEILSQKCFKIKNKNKIINYLSVIKLSAYLLESFLKGKKLKIKNNILESLKD
tara:strand:+ start:125 stop:775 length:651 start_codon:yes stop_codon:yes gene_type:complete